MANNNLILIVAVIAAVLLFSGNLTGNVFRIPYKQNVLAFSPTITPVAPPEPLQPTQGELGIAGGVGTSIATCKTMTEIKSGLANIAASTPYVQRFDLIAKPEGVALGWFDTKHLMCWCHSGTVCSAIECEGAEGSWYGADEIWSWGSKKISDNGICGALCPGGSSKVIGATCTVAC